MANYRIPPLRSGGLILSYRCTNACRHCLYRCSPKQPREFMSPEMMARVFAALAAEPHLQGIHLAGGEPGLDWDTLALALQMAKEAGVRVDYVETNASWCEDKERGRHAFRRLRSAGLTAVLISASLFHLEYIPLRKTLAAVKAAAEIFGEDGVIVWTWEALREMADRLDHARTYTLPESCKALGLQPAGEDLWRWHGYLIAGGRAATALTEGLRHLPAQAFASSPCRQRLETTSHFHIDLHGNLFTGLCPGIAPTTVDDLHPILTPQNAPIYTRLCDEGPWGLADFAREQGLPLTLADSYADKCQLCCDIRQALFRSGRFFELRPAEYY